MASEMQITLGDKLMVLPNSARFIGAATSRLLLRPFTSGPKPNTLLKDAIFAGLRTQLSIVSVATEQWMNASTESGYLDLAKKQGFKPETDDLGDGLKLFWLGKRTAEKTVLYCHGGGYALSATSGHLNWLYDLQKELAKNHSINAVMIGYTLSPYGQYPTQLRQAARALDRLLDHEHKKPSNVGDLQVFDKTSANRATDHPCG